MLPGILLLVLNLTVIPQQSHTSAPLSVDWSRQNLGPLDQAGLAGLTLMESDHHSSVLRCGDSNYPREMPRCRYGLVSEPIVLGGQKVLVGAVAIESEHDGMHSTRQSAVLVLANHERKVIGIMDLVALSVVDCATTVVLRRYAVADLDGDGGSELCVEAVVEKGQGLFHVMALEESALPWFPIAATRTIRAWRLSGPSLVEVHEPALVARCPTQPYHFFVEPPELEPATAGRLAVQGERTRFEQCPIGSSDYCLELESCSGASVGDFAVPLTAPWGPYGKGPDGKSLGIRARVRMASLKGTAQPVLIKEGPLLLWYEVKNFGTEPLTLWHAGFWTNHRIWLFDSQGRVVPRTQRGIRLDAAYAPGGPRGKSVRYQLEAGGADDTEGRYDLQALFRIPGEGLYVVRVDYQSDLAVTSNSLPIWLVSEQTKTTLDQLNGWPRDECDRHERPVAHPESKATGETNGFIDSRKALLLASGFGVQWHALLQRYHLSSN